MTRLVVRPMVEQMRHVNYICRDHGKFSVPARFGYGRGPAPASFPCSSCGEPAERPKRKHYRKPGKFRVSISGATYARLQAYCNRQGVTIVSVVDALTSDLGGAA